MLGLGGGEAAGEAQRSGGCGKASGGMMAACSGGGAESEDGRGFVCWEG